ncbi:Nascent polypeptide-associated complex subunit alpha [Myotis brandtii]|uniref:Nascent polypeptide-associated complex subunit alpha n=1 Tax=Myotis brandtii TaxID=109478 RepID=S7N0P7_MYOBR|nr:Nascent polypeptide-associated complex subunit alpha [Myotis brandtii]
MVITRMPMGAKSRAMGSVMPTMPPLEAEYAACPTWRKSEGHRWEGPQQVTEEAQALPLLTHLALISSHAGGVNDDPTLAFLVWFILAHLTSHKADHIEGSYEIHIDNSLEVLQECWVKSLSQNELPQPQAETGSETEPDSDESVPELKEQDSTRQPYKLS